MYGFFFGVYIEFSLAACVAYIKQGKSQKSTKFNVKLAYFRFL